MEVRLNTQILFLPSSFEGFPNREASLEVESVGTFTQSLQLFGTLASTPVIRPEQVARARELIAAVNYPPEQTIESLAKLLALNFEKARADRESGEAAS